MTREFRQVWIEGLIGPLLGPLMFLALVAAIARWKIG